MRLFVAIALAGCGAVAATASAADLGVYGEGLVNGYGDWTGDWGTDYALDDATHVHTGAVAIRFEPDAWLGVYLHRDGLSTDDYQAVRFWIYSAAGGQQIEVYLQQGGATPPSVTFTAAAGWHEQVISFADMGAAAGSFDGPVFQDGSGNDQAPVWIDDVSLDAAPPPPPPGTVDVTIDPQAVGRALSPLLFGVSFASPAQLVSVPYTLNRWGGNATTRYNWRVRRRQPGLGLVLHRLPRGQRPPGAAPGRLGHRSVDRRQPRRRCRAGADGAADRLDAARGSRRALGHVDRPLRLAGRERVQTGAAPTATLATAASTSTATAIATAG